MDSAYFFITGDVGTRPDFIEHEFLHKLDMLHDDYVEDIFLNRVSQDNVVAWKIFVKMFII